LAFSNAKVKFQRKFEHKNGKNRYGNGSVFTVGFTVFTVGVATPTVKTAFFERFYRWNAFLDEFEHKNGKNRYGNGKKTVKKFESVGKSNTPTVNFFPTNSNVGQRWSYRKI
jgi:hypothetical protein